MKKILIISHEAKRNGAPILILNLAKLLQKKNWQVHFLLKHDGDLAKDFSECGRTIVLHQYPKQNIFSKIVKKLRLKLVTLKTMSSVGSYDLVLSNTIVNGDLHSILKKNKNVYTYVHELLTTIKEYTTKKTLANVIDDTKVLLYPSEIVKRLLTDELNFSTLEFRYLPYYVPDFFSKKQITKEETKKKLGFDKFDFIIGGMGEPSWRKGTDVFLFTAKKVLLANRKVKFVWCGGDPTANEWLIFKSDIHRMGLENSVHLLPTQSDSWKVMSVFDIFYLSSREDAYPLVAIEAAMMKLPVVYFDRTGGIQEFIQHDAGIAAECMNIDDASEKIVQLMQNNQMYTQLSEKAREKYLSRHSEQVVMNFIDKVLI